MKTQSRPVGARPAAPPPQDTRPPAARPVAASTGTLPVREGAARRTVVAPATPAPAPAVAEAAPPDVGRPPSWLTLENGLYLLFFGLALATRFWDLGAKGLHHDESLHSVYSWKYYMDQGYIHSPMMHGPEQFHFIDLFYLLFGATDATARFASATCGVFLVMAPWFLRRQLGRWPALLATFLLLISPGFMYFTRFAREDAIYAAMEMLFVLGLWRFIDERKPRDFYVACAGYALMFTIKESAYLTTAVIGLLLVGLFAWQVGRWMFVTFTAYLAAAGGLALLIMKLPGFPKMPSIPAETPTGDNIRAFVTGLLAHPLIQAVGGVTILWLAVWGYLLWDQSNRVRRAALATAPVYNGTGNGAGDGARLAASSMPVRRVAGNAEGGVQAVKFVPVSAGAAPAEAEAEGEPALEAASYVTTELAAEEGAENAYADNGAVAENGHVENGAVAENGHAENGVVAENGHAENGVVAENGHAENGIVAGEPAPGEGPAAPPTYLAAPAAPRVPGLLERYQPGSLPYAVGYLLRHPVVLVTGLGIAVMLFVALYTSMFTNIDGIGTGLFGSLGYWIAQQDVRRGDQPWFYYLLLIPIYEPLIIVFGFTGMLYFAWKGLTSLVANRRTATVLYALGIVLAPIALPVYLVIMLVRSFRRSAEADAPAVPGVSRGFDAGKPVPFAEFRPFLVLFLMFWFIGAFLLYSWAGEKMPWLMIHMVQPLAFLAALALGQLVRSMIRHRRTRAARALAAEAEYGPPAGGYAAPASPAAVLTRPTSWVPFLSFVSLFVIICAFWGLNITHRVVNNSYDNWWQLAIWPALLVLVAAAYWSLIGGARVLRYVLVGVLAVLAVYGVRSAIQLSFYHAMDAREMAVYVQTAPDLVRAADTLDRLSVDQTGARDLKVIYDSEASWPMEWYFRDYKNKQFLPSGPSSAPDPNVAAMLIDVPWYDKAKSGQAPQLANFVGLKIVQRWWFPEDTYRNFVPDSWDNLDPQQPYKADGTPNFQLDANGKRVKAPLRQIQGTLDTILYTLRTPAEQGKLWKYLIYRQPYEALGSTDLALFVRKDLWNRYNYLASLDLPNYDSSLSR